MGRKNIKLRVANLVKKYDTAIPAQLASELGIIIVHAPLPELIRGHFTCPLRKKVITLNDKLDEREIPVVIAHELGHAVMHGVRGYTFHADSVNFVNARDEYEANLFALYLLSHSYDIDNRLLHSVPRHHDLMTYREAHNILCKLVNY